MGSKARKAFDRSAEDVDRLLEVHALIGGDEVGRRHRLEVLNKSAIVLVTAFWEAYCEDLAAEALEVMVTNAKTASKLPKELRKRVAKELRNDKNEIAIWTLSDNGWRIHLRGRLDDLRAERNWKLNTPRVSQVNSLFETALGIPSVSTSWKWKGMTVAKAEKKLDGYVTLRGAIAHRGAGLKSVYKKDVTDYFGHVKRLVAKTGGHVNAFAKRQVGRGLW